MFHIHKHLPCRDQDESKMKKWFYEHGVVGAIVAIRNTQAGVECYELDEIVELSSKRPKRFFTRRCHAYGSGYSPNGFFFSGISTSAPTGQIHAIIPTPIITELALQHVSWMYGKKSGVHTGPRYDQDFEIRARKQYQDLFPDWSIEKAKTDAMNFHDRVHEVLG